MLDERLLEEYISRFFGYGDHTSGSIYFVGLEEAGGRCEKTVAQRLAVWDELGKPAIVDGFAFLSRLHDCEGRSMARLFQKSAAIQQTWAKLIRLREAIEGRVGLSASCLREIQSGDWARCQSSIPHCLLELLPLPSPKLSDWYYPNWTRCESLKTRQSYVEAVAAFRIGTLQRFICDNGPSVVVFYGRPKWRCAFWRNVIPGIAAIRPIVVETMHGRQRRARIGKLGRTIFAVVNHPNSQGVSRRYYERVGTCIREMLLGE